MTFKMEPAKPMIGTIVHLDKQRLLDDDVIRSVQAELEDRCVLVFPQINLTDEEQLAFTDRLGERVDFTRKAPGAGAASQDVYTITLDKNINTNPDYVLGTFFWHIDGITIDQPLPKATLLSARKLSASGGATEFANLYAAYDRLSQAEKDEIENLRVIHTVDAAVRPVYGNLAPERVDYYRQLAAPMEQPLVWTHDTGRKSLLLGTHADGVVGMPGPQGRALLTRLQQWAAQPEFVYRHEWNVGDFVIWDNQGVIHRVAPYTDEGRVMHRTSIAGVEKPGRIAAEQDASAIYA